MFSQAKSTRRTRRSGKNGSRSSARRRLAFEVVEPRILLSHKGPCPGSPHCGGGGGGGGGKGDGGSETAYTVVDLGTLGGASSYAVDINDAAQVVGRSQIASGDNHAFLWEAGEMIDLGTLDGGSRSYAQGINGSGQVVGSSSSSSGGSHAVLWQPDGTMIDLGTLGGPHSQAFGINDLGQVVGQSWTTSSSSNQHAFLWQDVNGNGLSDAGEMIDLGALPVDPTAGGGSSSVARGINSSGWVVGGSWAYDPERNINSEHGFVIVPLDTDGDGKVEWFADNDGDGFNDLMIDLGTLGEQSSTATAINESGQIGGRVGAFGGTYAVLWNVDAAGNVTATELGDVRSFDYAYVYDVNDAAQVVGVASNNVFFYFSKCRKKDDEPYLWQNGKVIKFESLVTDMGGFADLDVLRGINNSGQIIGTNHLSDTICDLTTRSFIALPSTPVVAAQFAMAAVEPGETAATSDTESQTETRRDRQHRRATSQVFASIGRRERRSRSALRRLQAVAVDRALSEVGNEVSAVREFARARRLRR